MTAPHRSPTLMRPNPRRVLSIWLPALAIERWARTSDCPPDAPVVLTVEGRHGLVIHAVTKAAAERGARPGARLTDARALDPALVAVPADPAGDAALVERLARWAGRWSPLVEVDAPDGLRLDVGGVAHLFGGEEGLAADVQRRFAALGLSTRVAIAPTAAAAWALAHYAACICGPEELEAKLARLPAAALRLDADTVRTLERLGLKTIGAVVAMPRLALARRFRAAEDVIDALDRLVGRKAEPLTAAADEPCPCALLKLEEPATRAEAASQALERLIPSLVRELEQRQLGARRLTLTGFRVDGSTAAATVATAIASREPKHLQRLLAGAMERGAAALDPGFGFDAFALRADWAEPLDPAQANLVEEPNGEAEVARLIDRLSVRLGAEKVRRPVAFESHVPERASGWVPAVDMPSPGPSREREGSRPQRLLDAPEAIAVLYATPEGVPRRFVWRRAVHDIARVEGPERIAPEWWRERSTARLRDYYRVEDSEGRRYWIYREGLIGDGRGGAPAWFMHGLFG